MKLSTTEVDLYFDLMWKLHWYTNKENKIVSSYKSPQVYSKQCSMEDKMQVRTYLFNNIESIVKSFTQANPFQLNDEQLSIIQSWQKYIQGKFFIERCLKNYTIFIEQETDSVYGVISLYESFAEMIDKSNLPVYVEAILLPFQGKIIYDGLLRSYPVFFGSGIKGELKQVYLEAKQNNQIITNLETERQSLAVKVETLTNVKDWNSEIQELIAKAKKLRGGNGQPAIYSPLFSLIKLSLDLADKATSDSLDTDYFYQKLDRCENLLRQIENQVHYLDR